MGEGLQIQAKTKPNHMQESEEESVAEWHSTVVHTPGGRGGGLAEEGGRCGGTGRGGLRVRVEANGGVQNAVPEWSE